MDHQQYVERSLWELHKSPRNHIMDYVLGTPRDDSFVAKMVENGSIVRDFRFRGFPNSRMEKPSVPITVPFEGSRSFQEQPSTTVWVRNSRQDAGKDGESGGLVYGERPVDNSPRRRGLRKFPIDPGLDYRPDNTYGQQREEEELDINRYKRELIRHREREAISPQRDSRQGGRYFDGYHPEESQYQPSFGQGQPTHDYHSGPREVVSPGRGNVGVPVTDFMKDDEFHGHADTRGQNGLTRRESDRGAENSPRRGIPVTDFIKHDDLEGVSGGRKTGGRGYWLPEEPLYEPFGKAGGGAPVVDSTGKKRTTVFGNFERSNDPMELERDMVAKSRRKEDLFRGIEEQRNKRNEDVEYYRRPETDMAELMRRKEVGRPRLDPSTGSLSPRQHLPVSDVSKAKMNYQPRDGREAEDYRRFLQDQMHEREMERQQDRQRQQHEAKQPPVDPLYPKNYHSSDIRLRPENPRYVRNMVRSTHMNFYETPVSGWDKERRVVVGSPRYVRNTINSTHRNYYQAPVDRFGYSAPYATGYSYSGF